ncbi:tRNA adenosine(34) deaminase TadA [Variovorax ginsengisoli]|uniref:tRNA-specific adenosine deaminase n=1 Tax=Variovorax ginsengisoli TaxID=363844 RepID=A0ABT9SBK6_9BURK|nr:tRNA adenosine(34) deaminase TadA [Variovorax ginsengisoli]MDP9901736.1 tRNA(adenine34) deaminase [Variovorax ginsengisoli]
MTDRDWMALALAQAREAGAAGEVPVGAVLVRDGVCIATGRNAPVALHDPSAHAEINALRAGAAALGNYRLDGCELFVTLEPCAMCAGAMLHARLARVVFGAPDAKTGAAGSVVDLFAQPQLNHRTKVTGGVLADACAGVLQAFFGERRRQARAQAQPLREDALRTPDACFLGLPDTTDAAFTPHYTQALPRLQGWRMHYLDEGEGDAGTLVCLHGPGEWSYFFRHLPGSTTLRVLAPDLIGFGRSDKPKQATALTLDWHRDVLVDWLAEQQPGPFVLIHSAAAATLAQAVVAVLADVAQRSGTASPCRGLLLAPDAGNAAAAALAWRAPFPDRGHEAALRAWPPTPMGRSGPSPAQAMQLVQDAMGYFAS